jgi:sulfur-oxidizing protein SoxX
MASALLLAACAGFPDANTTRSAAEKMVAEAYPGMPEPLTQRTHQDSAQMICSAAAVAALPAEAAGKLAATERNTIKYPRASALMGDWKIGQTLAQDGAGMRVRGGNVEKVKQNGANCYACHELDPAEVNAGNIGPRLTGYGERGTAEAIVKYTYEKIYDAWAYLPCSNMPRMGHNGYLTPEQITHLVAYLLDPASPVNRR